MAWTLSPTAMRERLAGFPPPALIDARSEESFAADPHVIAGALRQDPSVPVDDLARDLEPWRTAVVYCARGAEKGRRVTDALRERGFDALALEGGLEAWRAGGHPTVAHLAATHWVTRERPKVDRIACPWLVRRFIDPAARIHYVPSADVKPFAERTGATPFDVPGVAHGHDGERCSFDAFIRLHALNDPPLGALADIVRAADTGRPELAAPAAGLLAVSLGLGTMIDDDARLLLHGMLVYDALYLACRDARAGTCEPSPRSTRTAIRA